MTDDIDNQAEQFDIDQHMGPGTKEDLEDLHSLLVDSVIAGVQGDQPSADMLAVARAMLKQEGVSGMKATVRERNRLRRLHGLLTRRLLDELKAGTPTPAMLTVARHFLRDNGVEKDLGRAAAAAAALRAIDYDDLPFKTTH